MILPPVYRGGVDGEWRRFTSKGLLDTHSLSTSLKIYKDVPEAFCTVYRHPTQPPNKGEEIITVAHILSWVTASEWARVLRGREAT